MTAVASQISPPESAPARRPRGRPRLDAKPRRERIIAEAASLFFRNGYAETTVDMVSRAAGVTKRTIYELVGDKEALFRAVCRETHADIAEQLMPLPASRAGLRDFLRHLARLLVDHAMADSTVAISRAVMVDRGRFPDLMDEVIGIEHSQLNAKIASYLAALAQAGLIGPGDAGRRADIFFDLTIGNRGFRKVLGHDEPRPEDADLAERVDIFITGQLLRDGGGLPPG